MKILGKSSNAFTLPKLETKPAKEDPTSAKAAAQALNLDGKFRGPRRRAHTPLPAMVGAPRGASAVDVLAQSSKLSPAKNTSGPVALDSAAGKAAVAKVQMHLPDSPFSITGPSSNYTPLRVQTDDLGITHVRLQREVGGVPIYGEQVAAQVRQNGKVTFSGTPKEALSPLPPMDNAPKMSPQEALQTAHLAASDKYTFSEQLKMDDAELVWHRTKDEDGQSSLRLAYHVHMTDFAAIDEHGHAGPTSPHLMIDAQSGKVLEEWNAIHIEEHEHSHSLAVNQSKEVNQVVGRDPVKVELNFEKDVNIETAKLKLGTPDNPGIEHDWRGDVVFNITSPSGKTTEIAPFGPNDSRDDLSGEIDLSEAFKGETSKGTWTIDISDRFRFADDGVVRKIGLELDGPSVEPPPPPPPPPTTEDRDDFAPFIGNVQLSTTKEGDQFVLKTPDGMVETRDARQQGANRVAGRFGETVPFTDDDDKWGGADASVTTKAAIETHYAASTFVPFLKETFGLDSLDNKGMKIQAMTNVGRDYNNAFWFGDVIHIGHGDQRVFDRLSSIDIVGHELAHGVTEKSADLIYNRQSGGLNESYSDVVGTMFEWWHSKKDGAKEAGMPPFDWKVGEESFTPGGADDDALRYMKDPMKDGRSLDHFSQYNDSTDVHYSSGISNNAFYLAVEGGTHRLGGKVDGLKAAFDGDFDKAMDAGGKIWMRALQFYLTPSSSFAQAREGTLQAAKDLYPDNPAIAESITQAWTAVGVEKP